MKRKNKQAEQTAQRKKHKENLKRRKEPLLSRQAPKRKEKQRILIVCEGKNTEPSYFKKFIKTGVLQALLKQNLQPLFLNS